MFYECIRWQILKQFYGILKKIILTDMKICLFCETYNTSRGGIESFTHAVAHRLSKMKHEVHVLTIAGDDKFYLEDNKHEFIRVHKIKLPDKFFPGFWRMNKIIPLYEIFYSCMIVRVLHQLHNIYKFDIFESSVLNLWYIFPKLPFVIRLHGYAGYEARYRSCGLINRIRLRCKWFIEKHVLSKASAIIAVSLDHLNAVHDIWGFNIKRNTTIIHNGIDMEDMKLVDRKLVAATEVLFVGRIKREKGIETIIKALPEVYRQHPTTGFIFIGNDSYDAMGNSYINDLTNRTKIYNVKFTGALSQQAVMQYYREIDICIFPSDFREPFPMVVLEAMANGCCVIVSDYGGVVELVDHGINGFRIPVGNSMALAKIINTLLNDANLLKTISENAVKRIKVGFTIDLTVNKTLVVYQSAIARSLKHDRIS
jgi:glycogen synthase